MKSFIQFLKESYHQKMLTEGKHWPEDYIKTAVNLLDKNLNKKYSLNLAFLKTCAKNIADAFTPLTHKNSNFGYYMPIVRWFIDYVINENNVDFLDNKLPQIIKTLLYISNNPEEESKVKDDIKTKWSLEDFEKYQKSIESKIKSSEEEKKRNFKEIDKGYTLIPIYSYEELNKRYGGDKTGAGISSKGWCHTNGKSTYNSWTDNGTKMFFVLEKKDWDKIKVPEQRKNAYDEYGLSLIAILVEIENNKLLKETLRWNHVIEPNKTKPGATVDGAFEGWSDLNETIGFDVEEKIKEITKKQREELFQSIKFANRAILNFLKTTDTITKENIKNYKKITTLQIPRNITTIKKFAFEDFTNLNWVYIPASIEYIQEGIFFGCDSLKTVTIENGNLHSIKELMFSGCDSLTSIFLPDSIKRIEKWAFSSCDNLKVIRFSNKLMVIEFGAFAECSNLTTIEIPDSVQSIERLAFYNCRKLTNVRMPKRFENEINQGMFDKVDISKIKFTFT